nr:DUF4430 domain-containing protein [Pullulanibacillus pueri]
MKAIKLKNNETAFDVLKEVSKDLDAPYNAQFDSVFINGINGVVPDSASGAYWGFIVNGQSVDVGASTYNVHAGDDILFKVVHYPPKTVSANVSLLSTEGKPLVDSNGQSINNKTIQVVQGSNAYDVLKQALGDKLNIAIDDQYLAFVKGIQGIQLKEGQYWGFNINGTSANEGISSYKVKDGDTLSLVGDAVGTADDAKDPVGDTNSAGSDDQAANSGPSSDKNNVPKITISANQLHSAITKATRHLISHRATNFYGAMALRLLDKTVPQTYVNALANEVKESQGSFHNVTDYEKIVLGVTSAGGDASNFEGVDLVKAVYSNERMVNQGNNGPIYGLLSLDSGEYNVPKNALWTRDKLVDYIINHQNKDGGWALTGSKSSADLTGIAIAALAPYKSESKVVHAINRAKQWLSVHQNKAGGYGSQVNGGDSSESTAQVILGLTAAGIDPTSTAFTKEKGNLISHLLSFQQKDGGFAHLMGEASNDLTTPQALLGLVSYQQYLKSHATSLAFDNKGRQLKVTTAATAPKKADPKQAVGPKLPDTATSLSSYFMISFILVMMGSLLLVYNRKKKRA